MKLHRGAFLAASAVALTAEAALRRPTRAAEAFTLRISIPNAKNESTAIAGQRLADAVWHKTNGRVKIDVYPSSQLANQEGSIQGVIAGWIDLTIQSAPLVAAVAPQAALLDLPYLFHTSQAAFKILDGAIGRELFASMEEKGMVGLCWGPAGWREIETTTKPIVKPTDLKGVRIRIQPGALYAAMFQTLGAVPVVVDNHETYMALSQNTIDGTEEPYEPVVTQRLFDHIKFAARSNHVYEVQPIVASKKTFSALPADVQNIMRQEAIGILPWWRQAREDGANEAEQTLRSKGITFNEVDREAFVSAAHPLYSTAAPKISASFLDRLVKAASST